MGVGGMNSLTLRTLETKTTKCGVVSCVVVEIGKVTCKIM